MVSKADRRHYEAEERKRKRMKQLKDDEEAGLVADSCAVRTELVKRMDAGELTLVEVQDELKRIQREAKKAGRPVRADYFKR